MTEVSRRTITSKHTDEHQPNSVTSRRSLLNAAPAALVLAGAGIGTAAAANASNPDAELIRLCAEYVRASREFCNVGAHTWEMSCSDPEWIRCHEAGCAMVPGLHAMEAQITDTPARTLLGVRAKAQAALHQLSGDADRDTGPLDPENWLVWTLIEETLDVLGRASA